MFLFFCSPRLQKYCERLLRFKITFWNNVFLWCKAEFSASLLHTLRKKGSLGFYIWSIGFTFYAKKGSIMTRKNPFVTKVLYRLLFIHIFHYFATFCSCLLNCCSKLISHFNHADFWRRKTEMVLFVWYWLTT